YTHLMAASLFEDKGQESRRQLALNQAERDARALERFPTLPTAVNWRYVYYQYIGREEAAYDDLRRIAGHTENRWTRMHYSLALYRRRAHAQAIEVSDRRGEELSEPPLTWYVTRAFHLAELPDGPARAYATYQQMTTRQPRVSGQAVNWGMTILQLL